MTEHLRAHNASRVADCPGSLQLQYGGKRADVDNPSMAFGREMHSLVEDFLLGKIELEEIENEEHREWVARCVVFVSGNVPHNENGKPPADTEVKLYVLGERGEHIASSRADAVIWRDEETLVIPDWKFYHQPLNFEEHQLQLLVMCVAALQTFPKAQVAQGILYLPIVDHTHNLDLTRDLLEESLEQLTRIWRYANMDNPRLEAGKWCARCPALARCPVAMKSIRKIDEEVDLDKYLELPKLPSVKAMETGILTKIHNLSPARFRRLVELFPLLAPLQDAIRKKLREDLDADPASHSGWELTERRGRSSAPPEALRTVAGDFAIDDKTFNEKCMSVSVASFRALLVAKLRELNPDAKKKDIEAQVMKAIEPIIEVEKQTILKRR